LNDSVILFAPILSQFLSLVILHCSVCTQARWSGHF